MKIAKDNKGITMVALVITIIVLLILASVSIGGSLITKREAVENAMVTELNMVEHAALERYTKVSITGEEYPGTQYVTIDELKQDLEQAASTAGVTSILSGSGSNPIVLQSETETDENGNTKYYRLGKDDLSKLGITNTEDEYIINYERGEVINLTQIRTNSGEALYVCAKPNDGTE